MNPMGRPSHAFIVTASAIFLITGCRADGRAKAFAGQWETDTGARVRNRITVALRLDASASGQVRGVVGIFGWDAGGVSWVRGSYRVDSINLTVLSPCQADSPAAPLAIGFRGVRFADSAILRGDFWDGRPEGPPSVAPITLRRGHTPWVDDQFRKFEHDCPGGLPSSGS